MTYKDKLLDRLMESTSPFAAKIDEATPEDREDGLADGFAIPLDAQARALSSRVKMPMARRIVALLSMSGIPGRYLASEDAEGGIMRATDMLRKKASTRKAFLDFYNSFATTLGYATPGDDGGQKKQTAKDRDDEAAGEEMSMAGLKEAQKHTARSFATWRRQAKAAAHGVWFEGDKDIATAFVGEKPYKVGKTIGIGEWDGDSGYIDTTAAEDAGFLGEAAPPEAKKGDYLHKLFTTVLIELGMPDSLAGVTAPGAVQAGLHKAAQMVGEDGALERTLRLLAMRLGVKADEIRSKVGGEEEPEVTEEDEEDDDEVVGLIIDEDEDELDEAADAGNDEFTKDVMALVSALGVPDEILERRRPQLIQAMRERKQTLRNRGTIQNMVKRLSTLLSANTVQASQADGEEE